MQGDGGRSTATLTCLLLLTIRDTLSLNPGTVQVNSGKGGDYCFLFPSRWMALYRENAPERSEPEPSSQNLTHSAMCCLPSFLGDAGGVGGCNVYENARLLQVSRTRGRLTLGGDAPFLTPSGRAGHQWGRCEEITLPGILLSDGDVLCLLFKGLTRDLVYKTGLIYLLSMAVVTIGSYWAGRKRQHAESQDRAEFGLGETPLDAGVPFTISCTLLAPFHLLVLCCLCDYLDYAAVGLFCLYASFSLYSFLTPFVSRMPLGRHTIHVSSFHKELEIRSVLLAGLCLGVNASWAAFGNGRRWGWVLQDGLGICLGVYTLRTVRAATLRTCSLLLLAHLFYDVLSRFLGSFLTLTGKGGTGVAVFASSYLEEIPFLLQVPMLSAALDPEGGAFAAVSLGEIVVPGLLVAYCCRFDAQIETAGVYFLASTLAYSYGLLVTFMVTMFFRASQPTISYLVPCVLVTSLAIAACRKEVTAFWTGVSSADDASQASSSKAVGCTEKPKDSETQGGGKQTGEEGLYSFGKAREELSDPRTRSEVVTG